MAKITIDGVDYEVSDQAAQAVGKLHTRLKDAEMSAEEEEKAKKAKEDEMEAEKEKSKATKDSYEAKLADLKTQIPTGEVLDKLVAERSALVDSVKKVAPEVEWEGKDAETLMKEVVAAKCDNVQMDSVSADYIKARFDMLVEAADSDTTKDLDNVFQQQAHDKETKVGDNRPASVIARDKMIERNRSAWKGGAK